MDRIANIVERGDLRARVSLLADEQGARALTRLVNRTVLALLGGVVGSCRSCCSAPREGRRSPVIGAVAGGVR
jgi:hypothetical protein